MSLNKTMLIGRLGEDPDVRYTKSDTAVANLSVATSERYKDKQGEWQDKTEWHRVVAWGRLAEICQEYLKKGSQVYIEGPLQTRKWEDKEGNTKYTTEVKALTMTMLDKKGDDAPSKESEPQVDLNDDVDIDDDLPF